MPKYIIYGALAVIGDDCMEFGQRVQIGWGARIECIKHHGGRDYHPTLTIGDDTTAEMFLHIGCADRIVIGKDCIIGGHVTITDHEHGLDPSKPLHGQPLTTQPILIGDGVFIGEGVTILKGVRIGDRAVVGAGAVVTRSVVAGDRVGGVPAHPLGVRS
jgi:acetyltransferase-like isoleucine patch superfamily enzyme